MLFKDAKQNDLQVISERVKLFWGAYKLNVHDIDRIFDFSEEAYDNAQEIYKTLKPMSAVEYKKIRLGPQNDGGYVFLDIFGKMGGIAYSFGISFYDPFSLDMLERGYEIWQYDGTIDTPPYDHPHIHFNRANIGDGRDPQANERSLRQIIDENGHGDLKNIILQCDIEGGEWAMLETARTEDLAKFALISLEVHYLYPSGDKWRRQVELLKKLNETHQVIHVHGNNGGHCTILKNFRCLPSTIEISYVRRDVCRFTECTEEFPTALDSPCTPLLPDIFIGSFNPVCIADPKENVHSNLTAQMCVHFHEMREEFMRQIQEEIQLRLPLRRGVLGWIRAFAGRVKQGLGIR